MANGDFIVSQVNPQRELPSTPMTNGVVQPMRSDRYAQPIVTVGGGGGVHQLASEGSYFVATNPTLGTGISGTTAPTAFSATVALMSIYNTVQASGGKEITLHWIRLEPRAAGTSGTSFQFAMSVDTGNRFSSGGTALTPVNPNIGNTASSNTSIATVNFGALTATAASANVRRVSHGQIRPVIKVVGDCYVFYFGQNIAPGPGADIGGTNVQSIAVQCPPVVLGPNSSFLLHEVAPSQAAAATYELTAAWSER